MNAEMRFKVSSIVAKCRRIVAAAPHIPKAEARKAVRAVWDMGREVDGILDAHPEEANGLQHELACILEHIEGSFAQFLDAPPKRGGDA
jgi:hypothetical protein